MFWNVYEFNRTLGEWILYNQERSPSAAMDAIVMLRALFGAKHKVRVSRSTGDVPRAVPA